MEAIFAIYEPGFSPKLNIDNLRTYIQSSDFLKHCKTVKVYFNSRQLNGKEAKRVIWEREPVNMDIHPHYDQKRLRHGSSIFNQKNPLVQKEDGSFFKDQPHTAAIYSETRLWPIPGQKNFFDVAILSLPAPALDSEDQPHWKFYVSNGKLNIEKYKAEMHFLAQMVVQSMLRNLTTAFDGEGINRVLLSRYGQDAFLSKLKPNDRDFARHAFYSSLVKVLKEWADELKAIHEKKPFKIVMFNYESGPEDAMQKLFVEPLKDLGVPVERSDVETQGEGEPFKTWDILKQAQKHDLIINAWDPHSLPGNGCDSDRSLDGALGKGSGIPLTQTAWLNTHLTDLDRYIGVDPDWTYDLPQVNVLDKNGRIFMGSYPGHLDPKTAERKMRVLSKELGVVRFINLMTPEEMKTFAPYEDLAKNYGISLFSGFPITDMWIVEGDEEKKKFLEFIEELAGIVKNKEEKIYIHCHGGHGRTGLVSAILIAILENLSSTEALALVERQHGKRVEFYEKNTGLPIGALTHSPQTDEQKKQVEELIQMYRNKHQLPA